MKAGKRRHLVTIQKPTASRNSFGEVSNTWSTHAQVYASIAPAHSSEQFATAQTQTSITHTIGVEYSTQTSGVTSAYRIKFGARIFHIDGPPRNVDERDREIVFECVEETT